MMSLNIEQARTNMVDCQVRGWDVIDRRVLNVLGSIPREAFVPDAWRNLAFADLPIPLGHGEVMMKPVVEGRMLQALQLQPHEHVLEIGTGSGFISACLAQMASHVTSIEIHADFVATATTRLHATGHSAVEIIHDDAVKTWQPTAQFDVLVATGAVASVPEQWLDWLKPGGRAFVICGRSPTMQAMMLRKASDNHVASISLFDTDLPYLQHAGPVSQFQL